MALIGIDASRANISKKTGTELYSHRLIQALKRIQVPGMEYVMYSKKPLKGGLEDLPEQWNSKVLSWGPKRFWNQIRLSWELWSNPVDLFFQPTHTLPLHRPKLIVSTLHDIGFERFPELYSKTEVRYHRHSARLAIRRANRILTVSEFSKREIMEVYNIPENKIVVTHLGYDPEKYHPEASSSDVSGAMNNYRLSRPFFIYIGRVEEKKNIVNLIHAFSIFKGWRGIGDPIKLFLAGSYGYGIKRIKAEIVARKMEDHIVMPGYVPDEELPGLLASAEALVFPSRYEGFGLPIIQAQASGTPVLTSNTASMPEVGGDGALYVNPDASEQIAQGMKRIVDEANLRDQLRLAGFENVKRFSWEETARKTMNVLLEVLGIQRQI